MAKPDYVPEGDEERWGITTIAGKGTVADYIPGSDVDRVADGLMSADQLPPGTPAPAPREGPRDTEADERSRTGAAKIHLPGGTSGPPLAVAMTQPPAKNRGGKGKGKADATPKPEPDVMDLQPKTLEEALAYGLTEETGGAGLPSRTTPEASGRDGDHVRSDDERLGRDASEDRGDVRGEEEE